MDETQDKILVALYKGYYRLTVDEGYLAVYKNLEQDTGITRAFLKPHMIELRNNGYVALSVAVDFDEYRPNGSGYGLTKKGDEYVLEAHPDLKDYDY